VSQHDQDDDFNPSDNIHFQTVLTQGLSSPMRRQILCGGVGLSMASVLPGCATLGQEAGAPNNVLGFSSLDKSLEDRVVLPPGYRYTVLHASGDPLDLSLSAFSSVGTEQDDWSRRIGDHHDGMDLYFIDANGRYTTTDTGRAVLAVNHESSADSYFMHPNGQTSNGVAGKKFSQFGEWDLGARPELEVLKEINHHGDCECGYCDI
jgi:secreted PhoX family phosphatase